MMMMTNIKKMGGTYELVSQATFQSVNITMASASTVTRIVILVLVLAVICLAAIAAISYGYCPGALCMAQALPSTIRSWIYRDQKSSSSSEA
jgi:hypothetical protein